MFHFLDSVWGQGAARVGRSEASGEPGVTGDFWGSQEGCQGPSRPSGRNRGLPLRRRRGQGRGSALSRLGAELELRRSGSSLGEYQHLASSVGSWS